MTLNADSAGGEQPVGWPRRFTIILFFFTCTLILYIDRVSISVVAPVLTKEFGWDEAMMGTILSAFFVGYLFTLFGQWFLAARRSWPDSEEHRDVMLFFSLLILATIVTGMFSPVFESPHFAVPLFFLFGFATGLNDLRKRGLWKDGQLLADTRPMNL